MEHNFRYSIIKTAHDGERANAWVTFSLAPTPYTEGSGSFTMISGGTIESDTCLDGLAALSASASAVTGLDTSSLSNDFGVNGLFVDPANDQNGFDFNVHEAGLTIFYYGHTTSEERLWLTSQLYTGDLEFDVPYELSMFEVLSGSFGQSAQSETLWGTLTFTLDNCDTGNAVLSGFDGNAEFNLLRLAGQHGSKCQ